MGGSVGGDTESQGSLEFGSRNSGGGGRRGRTPDDDYEELEASSWVLAAGALLCCCWGMREALGCMAVQREQPVAVAGSAGPDAPLCCRAQASAPSSAPLCSCLLTTGGPL